MMKNLFLPVGLLLALIAALVVPAPGMLFKSWGLIPVFVVVIFLINGWQFRLKDASMTRSFFQAFLLAGGISLLLGPWLGVWISRLFGLSPMMTVGMVVMATVPVTLSSAIVMAELCSGNRAWALLMTVGLNLCGIFSVPLMLSLCLEGVGSIEISATKLLFQLMGLVLVPFLLGWVARVKWPQMASPALLGFVPSTCVILTVYVGFAASGELLLQMSWREGLTIGLAALLIHGILLILAWVGGRLLELGRAERSTMLFVISQKTLPLAVTVVALILPSAATALIPCLLFHFIQLFLDSFLASKLGHREGKFRKQSLV